MKKKLFPLESTENESEDALVRITVMGDKVPRYHDVVSGSSIDKGHIAPWLSCWLMMMVLLFPTGI